MTLLLAVIKLKLSSIWLYVHHFSVNLQEYTKLDVKVFNNKYVVITIDIFVYF